VAEWLDGVDLLDPEAVAAAARPVMAAMTNPNGLDRAQAVYEQWDAAVTAVYWLEPADFAELRADRLNALEAVGLDLMDGKDWCESATGVRR
jgi:hypothetical protein